MIQKLKTMFASAALMLGVGVLLATVSTPVTSAAIDCKGAKACIGQGVNKVDNGTKADALGGLIQNIINILLFIVGVAAVVMIIIGGLKYVTSNGDSSAITSAKNTIMYAIIGLVVAGIAYAIVNFVVAKL